MRICLIDFLNLAIINSSDPLIHSEASSHIVLGQAQLQLQLTLKYAALNDLQTSGFE